MTNIKKYLKNTSIFAGCFFTVILLAFVVYFQFFQQVPMKSKNILLNDSYDSLTQAMPHGGTISQRLTVEGNISGLGLQINKVSDTLDGRMKIHVEDENGNVLHDGDIGFSRVIPNAYTCFALDNPASYREPTELKIEIHTVYADENIAQGQMISLRKSARQHDSFGRLIENGKTASGSLAILLVTDMLGTSPIKLFLIFALLAAVFCGGIALLCFSFKAKKGLVVFAALFSIGLLYQIILPPFSAPDEFIHYNSAYNLSNKRMGVESDIDGGVLKRECDAQSRFTDYSTTAFTYKYIYENFTRPNTNDNYVFAGEEYLKGYNAPRLLSAVSLTFCRAMNFGGVFTAYFVRFVNMLFYSAMMSLAFCLLPIGKNSMLALSALPIAIHLGGSYSYDSFLIAISSVLTALCFNCILSEKKISRIKMASVAALCFILAPLKNAYFLLVLLPLLIPAERFKDKKAAYLFKAAIIAVSAGSGQTIGLRLDGTVVAVGDNEHGECSVSSWRDIIAIAAGSFHTVGLKLDGTVVAVGENKQDQCCVDGWRNIVAIAAGSDHTVGIRADGTVVAVGDTIGKDSCKVTNWRLFNNIDGLKNERKLMSDSFKEEQKRAWERFVAEQKAKFSSLQQERTALINELNALKGLFTGRRRRQLTAQIAQIDAQLHEIKYR